MCTEASAKGGKTLFPVILTKEESALGLMNEQMLRASAGQKQNIAEVSTFSKKSMFRIIISIIIIFGASFISHGIFASDSMTGTAFMISLVDVDPVSDGESNIDGQGGIEVLTTLLANLSDLFLYIIPIIAALSFLVAGYFYIFSAGDSEKVGRAKTIIKWNIIAIFVSLLSYGIINFIAQIFT